MQITSDFYLSFWWLVPVLLVVAGIFIQPILRVFGVILIAEDEIGIVNKKFVLIGNNRQLPDGTLIALNGEAGLQADPLPPGVHFLYWPWQYEITKQKWVTVKQGQVGVVEARDGEPLENGRNLGRRILECDQFQDARAFLENGGQRGPQGAIMTPGTYRINTALFQVMYANALEVTDDEIAIVTTKDGVPLSKGDIAGRQVEGHNMFQDPDAFIATGGNKGLQEQVILAGRYYINPLFATVEMKPLSVVPVANVGVVVSYVGDEGQDVTGKDFAHGNLVSKGQKGVWVDPLDPGKYAINPYTHNIELVPTANIVLNWANAKTESHMLDEKLSTITLRSADGFKFNLDVSQIIHIPRNEAPMVIARFGSVANLVTQVLEPTIGNYFRNTGQSCGVIDFLQNRAERQDAAKEEISKVLDGYNVVAVDTLIGDIVPPDELMKTLTDRKQAEQEQLTYGTQQLAEDTRAKLQQAKAMADTQAQVVERQRKVEMADFDKKTAVLNAEGEAGAKKIQAQADAEVTQVTGDAEAGRIKAIGEAEAEVVRLKIASMESGNYAAIEVSKNLSVSKQPIVPAIISGGGEKGTIVDVMLANVLANQLGIKAPIKDGINHG